MYLSASELGLRLGFDDLARIVGARIKRPIQSDALEAVLADAPLDDFLTNVVEAVTKAKQRIELALTSAEALITSYVTKRYPEGLTQDVIDASPLPQIAVYLVKHELMVATDEETRLNHKMAMSQLRDISTGTSSLGVADPKPTSSSHIRTAKSNSQFSWDRFGR